MTDAFKALGGQAMGWADPAGLGVSPTDADDGGGVNPARYRVLAVRAQAWATALRETGLASTELVSDDPAFWRRLSPLGLADRVLCVLPSREGALPLLFAMHTLDGVAGAQVGLGAGEPGVPIEHFPESGDGGEDTGSAGMLAEFDDVVLSVVTGRFLEVSTEDFVAHDTLRGGTFEGTLVGTPARSFDDLFAAARAGTSPHEVVQGKRWW